MLNGEWRKSTRSGGGDNCVEVRRNGSLIETRHSQRPDAEIIAYTETEWSAFLDGAKAGEFDL